MTSVYFEVDTDSLRQNLRGLQEDLNTLQSMNGRLQGELESLSGMWRGPAKEAFHAGFRENCEELRDLCSRYSDVFSRMADAAQKYDACDAKVRSTVDSI